MSWQMFVKSSESLLASSRVPPSEEIISLIKRVNPTPLQLSEEDREHGYQVKNRLQNLLLENYGEAFHLAPHPYSPDIVIIKHNTLPSVDACHADRNALSAKALDTVDNIAAVSAVIAAKREAKREAKGAARKTAVTGSPREALRNAELLLERYEYPQAEEMLAAIRIADTKDLPVLLKAAEVLTEEMGAYQRAIELVLAQPGKVLKDKAVRELLALTYYGNGMIAEARALLDAAHPGDLGKSALHAYADISLKDGKLSDAYHLLKLSEGKEGLVTAHANLRREIEAGLAAEASPFVKEADEAFAHGDLAQAETLVHKALFLYPDYREARRLAGQIEALKSAGELKRLWAQLNATETAAERLDLLAQLSERDRGNGEKIRTLIATERSRLKQETLEDSLRTLENYAASERWNESFDILFHLSRQDEQDIYRQACGINSFFSVLYHNKMLQRLPEREAKEQWLRFVRLKGLLRQGRMDACWNLAQALRQYFHPYPAFREEYDSILELEQAKARDEVQRLLTQLEELTEPEDLSYLAEAKGLAAAVRKRSVVLPVEEGASYRMDAEMMINSLERSMAYEESIIDYRDCLLLGNADRAAELRELHGSTWTEGYIKMIDAEVVEKFAIWAEPITFVFSQDLAVDLTTESALTGLHNLCSTSKHLLFREDDETILVVNVERKSATRCRSCNFKGLAVMDFLPDKDLFLFVNTEDNVTVWRAILSDTESRFTSVFEINRHFVYQEGARFEGLFMASGKENAYYAVIQEEGRLRVVKQTIGLASSAVGTFELTGESKGAYRLSYQPDRFVITTETNTAVLESNLTQPKRSSRVGTGHMLSLLGIDTEASQIYALGDGIVNVLNLKLYAIKQFLGAASVAYIDVATAARICVEKNTVLMNVNAMGIFYNMQTNKFSQKFSKSRLAATETPSRWFYFDFDGAEATLTMRDITDEVDSLLEWRVLLAADDVENEAAVEFAAKLNDPEFFQHRKATGTATDSRRERISCADS